jgi:hypothetical protein
MKTILEYFNELPEPYRSQAIENTDGKDKNIQVMDLAQALLCGFDWQDSKQGAYYWDSLYSKIFPNPNFNH